MNKRNSFKLKGFPEHATSAIKKLDPTDPPYDPSFGAGTYLESEEKIIPEVVIEGEDKSHYDFGGGDSSDKSFVSPEDLVSGYGSETNISKTTKEETKEEKIVDNTRKSKWLISDQLLGDIIKNVSTVAAQKLLTKKKKDPVRIVSGKQTKIV